MTYKSEYGSDIQYDINKKRAGWDWLEIHHQLTEGMDIEKIKETPIADFLSRLGFHPVKRRGAVLWFHAPYWGDKARRSNSTPDRKSGLTSAWMKLDAGNRRSTQRDACQSKNIFHDYMRFCRYKGWKVKSIERKRYVEFALLYIR